MTIENGTHSGASPDSASRREAPVLPELAQPAPGRPTFIEAISTAYSECGKSAVVLTGNTHDLFEPARVDRFLDLERTLYQELHHKFTVVRFDCATGIGTIDSADLSTLAQLCLESDGKTLESSERIGDFKKNVFATRYDPLPAMLLLKDALQAVTTVRMSNKGVKPVLVIMRAAGSLFPSRDFDGLSMDDRKMLVTFLSLIESPWFKESANLIVLVADTQAEVNARIVSLPSVHCAEIDLPNASERARFVTLFKGGPQAAGISFEVSADNFVEDTAGLTLTSLQDMLETSRRTRQPIKRLDVLAEINRRLKSELGEMVTFSRPEHGPADIIGYEEAGKIFLDIFRRCEKAETAVPVILVSGPNGSGKTYQMEAYASQSGRVVIELKGLRSKWLGETDAAFEKLRLRLRTYTKVLILIDEAHTAFGSVHDESTHETERRLAGNFIKLMGDPAMFGKVLWGLMTSRPDALDPDVKSRAPIQVPIFDLEGDERAAFVTELFARKGLPIPEPDLPEVLRITANYSSRDFSFLVKEAKGQGKSALETLSIWRASTSILRQRRMQMLIAANHCSYPALLPADLRERIDSGEDLEAEIGRLLRGR